MLEATEEDYVEFSYRTVVNGRNYLIIELNGENCEEGNRRIIEQATGQEGIELKEYSPEKGVYFVTEENFFEVGHIYTPPPGKEMYVLVVYKFRIKE